jgi:excisionase family DNA binding protein
MARSRGWLTDLLFRLGMTALHGPLSLRARSGSCSTSSAAFHAKRQSGGPAEARLQCAISERLGRKLTGTDFVRVRHIGRGVGARTSSGAAVNGSLLTAGQVAKLLGVPTSWVYEQSRRGRIPTVTLGRYRRYRAEAIDEWLEELERSGQSIGLSPRGTGGTRIPSHRAGSANGR